ncbi:protein-L-isoaspartate O-methyltransferase [Gammaproteobacteria bacterium]|nr:protein-L-isoaspartate O-methyltransferase [Gammaproteobacteria bacterium]
MQTAIHDDILKQNRFNMIEQQIRPCNVLNQNVLNTLYALHREDFVPVSQKELAFAETRLMLDENTKMLTPILEGKILQVIDLVKTDRVLVVGTGSAYLSACCANLSTHVTSIDINDMLTQTAITLLKEQNINNIDCITQSLEEHLKQALNHEFSYDAVILTGSIQSLPDNFKALLKENGRLFAVVGASPSMHACVFYKFANDLRVDNLFETELERLIGFEDPIVFEF